MNEGRHHGTLKHWDFILIDLLCLQGGFLLAYRILHTDWHAYRNSAFLIQGALYSICQLLMILFFDQYHGILRRKRFDEFLAVCKMIGEALLLELVFLFILHNTNTFSRLQTSLTTLIYIFIDYSFRQFNKRHKKAIRNNIRLLANISALFSEFTSYLFVSNQISLVRKIKAKNSSMKNPSHILDLGRKIELLSTASDKLRQRNDFLLHLYQNCSVNY